VTDPTGKYIELEDELNKAINDTIKSEKKFNTL